MDWTSLGDCNAMRFVCLDIGEKRTGVAVGDDESGIVSPAPPIELPVGPPLLARVRAIIADHQPDRLVVGLPLNMDGSQGRMAARMAQVAEQIADDCGLPVDLHDERLTTFSADQTMARSGLTHGQKKKRRDSLAAAAILRDFIESANQLHDHGTGDESGSSD